MVLSKLKEIKIGLLGVLSLVYAFLLPFNQVVSTIFLMFFLGVSILKVKKKDLIINKQILLPVVMYVLLALSFLWSSNINLQFLQKFALLVFLPILFILNGYGLTEERKIVILKSFVIGCVCSVLYCEIYTTYRAAVFWPTGFHAVVQPGHTLLQSMSQGGNLYFGKYFSSIHTPIYASSFLILAFFTLLYLPFKNKTINFLCGLILMLGVFQISNRSSLLILIFLILIYLFNRVKKNGSTKIKVIASISFALFVFVIFLNPRLNTMIKSIYETGISVDPEAKSTYGVRVLVWDAALDLIKQSPVIGHGAGGQDYLYEFYKSKNYLGVFKSKLNSHNQYLTTFLEIGVFGFALLVLMIWNVFSAKNIKDLRLKKISQIFSLIFMISILFESMLQRYSGLLFFCFFYCLFISKSSSNLPSNKEI